MKKWKKLTTSDWLGLLAIITLFLGIFVSITTVDPEGLGRTYVPWWTWLGPALWSLSMAMSLIGTAIQSRGAGLSWPNLADWIGWLALAVQLLGMCMIIVSAARDEAGQLFLGQWFTPGVTVMVISLLVWFSGVAIRQKEPS